MSVTYDNVSTAMRNRRQSLLVTLLKHLAVSFTDYQSNAPVRIQVVAWIGVVGFPLYYLIWTFIYPQPYENLPLRLSGMFVCLILISKEYWPHWANKYYLPFSYFLLIYTLPFFFTFMLLMNGTNVVWSLSAMSALLFTAILFDTANMIVGVLIGAGFGYVSHKLIGVPVDVSKETFEIIPVFIFTLCAIRILLKYNDRYVEKEKLRAAKTLASHIAHEMRTPLAGIQFDAKATHRGVDYLLECEDWAIRNGWQGGSLKGSRRECIHKSLDRICNHAESSNNVIDMLLVNAGRHCLDKDSFDCLSMRSVVDEALSRYVLETGIRNQITFNVVSDFTFRGPRTLTVHLLFNLIKNSLQAVSLKGVPDISIVLEANDQTGRLSIHDNGVGIPEDIRTHLFTPFHTSSSNHTGSGSGSGSGLGLAFCKLIAESCGGRIDCTSRQSSGTTFEVTLPIDRTNTCKRRQELPI